jgi:hypothetical protein
MQPTSAEHEVVNEPPAEVATAVFIFRQIVAIIFIIGWLILLGIDIFNELELVPFWLNCVGVGVLAYALGMNVADITAFKVTVPQMVGRPPR